MNNMLDKLDRMILQQLELDSRQSNASIARRIKSNKTIVNYRIERLHKNGIIKGYTYISNQAILGKLSFGLLIKFKDILLKQQEELIKKFRKKEQISWIQSIDGKWDLMIVIIEKDINSFNKVLQNIFSLCEDHIKEYNFYVDYEGSISGHDYLYENDIDLSVSYISGNILELKKSEAEVYNLLKENPKLSLLQIAHKLGTTYDTIKSKYNYLKSKNILLKCTPKININALGYFDHICLFNISPSQEKLKQLVNFCSQHPNIVRYSKCLGHFNLILNIQCKDNNSLKEILYQIRNKFPETINSYEIIPLTE